MNRLNDLERFNGLMGFQGIWKYFKLPWDINKKVKNNLRNLRYSTEYYQILEDFKSLPWISWDFKEIPEILNDFR